VAAALAGGPIVLCNGNRVNVHPSKGRKWLFRPLVDNNDDLFQCNASSLFCFVYFTLFRLYYTNVKSNLSCVRLLLYWFFITTSHDIAISVFKCLVTLQRAPC
jgi:hypothetical protein